MSARPRLSALAVLAAAFVASTSLGQQNAPERVRAFAALPDWAGLWETEFAAALASGEFAREAASAARSAPAPQNPVAAPLGDPFLAALRARVKLFGDPPYNDAWEAKRRPRSFAAAAPAGNVPAAGTICSWGFPAIVEAPFGMFEAAVTPEETVFVFPDGEVRHVYTDGRSHPKKEDLWPTPMGDSVGRWEDGVLVIDTIARKAGSVFPIPNLIPGIAEFSDQAHFVERLRRIDANDMQNELTIEDPLRFAHPWHISIRYKRVQDVDRMIHTDCTENERNVVVNGRMTISPP
ncbi:MAG TPA: hypothetical protein VFY39_16975 [Gammaproteobacteria bacterium]|nr:hypothetical protein [Gammaproteobacteria bacterium]